jgi:superfamily I DNA/RNA helicase
VSDAAVRYEVLDTTKSFCVTAPAGSGKTSLLTQRVLALLVTVERPEQLQFWALVTVQVHLFKELYIIVIRKMKMV